MIDSQATPEDSVETTDDRVSDALAQLEEAGFSIGEYHRLAQTILRMLATSHEDMIDEDTSTEEACALTFLSTIYANAEQLLSVGEEDDDGMNEEEYEDNDDIE